MRLWTLGVVALVAGCSAQEGDNDEAAGTALRWTVDPVPITVVEESGTPVVQYPRDATRLPSGVVAVADQYAAAVHFFGPDGRLIRTRGTAGDGPGEFGNPMMIDRCGVDSLFVWDYTKRTVIVTDTAGAFVREFRPAGAPHELSCSSPDAWLVLGMPQEFLPPGDDDARSPAPLWLADGNGQLVAELGEVPFREVRPLGKVTRVVTGADAYFVGTADSALVERYSYSGEILGGWVLGIPGQVPTDEQYSESIEREISVTPDAPLRDRARAQLAEIPKPRYAPPYRELFVDPDGMLWALTSSPGASTTTMHGSDGTSGSRVELELPGRVDVLEVGRDYVLGVQVDDLGVRTVVVHALQRPTPAGS